MSKHGMKGPAGGGPIGKMAMGGEKPKDFKKTMKNLIKYLKPYILSIFIVMIFAIGSAAFSIVGPKILGNATTEIFNGLIKKIATANSEGINFDKIGKIIIFLLALYIISTIFSLIQGWMISGVAQKVSYNMRRQISGKINRMPLKYFDTRTHGEVLSELLMMLILLAKL
jgi:ATP-binding cassette subfamily B protein